MSGFGMPRLFSLTYLLVAINSLVFATMCLGAWTVPLLGFPSDLLLKFGASFGPYTLTDHQYWRVATAIFVHNGLLHLLLNMWALWVIGGMLESLFGRPRFLVTYLCAGCSGVLSSLLWEAGVVTCGASGAIFGALGCAVTYSWIDAERQKRVVSQAWIVIASIVYSVILGFLTPGIDNANHIGGLVMGLLLGFTAGIEELRKVKVVFPTAAMFALISLVGALAVKASGPDFSNQMQVARYRQEALSLIKGDQPKKAVEALTQAIQLSPESDLYLLRSSTFTTMKNFPAAVEDSTKVLSMDQDDLSALLTRATAYHLMGNEEGAIADFGRLIQLDPHKALAYNNRAWAYLAKGDYSQAMDDINVALDKDPNLSTAYDTRGTIFICLGKNRDALNDLDRAIKIDNRQSAAFFHRAIALETVGVTDQAAKDKAMAAKLGYEPEEWELLRFKVDSPKNK